MEYETCASSEEGGAGEVPGSVLAVLSMGAAEVTGSVCVSDRRRLEKDCNLGRALREPAWRSASVEGNM